MVSCNFTLVLYTAFELAICYGLYYWAMILIRHGQPVKIWYDKNDPSIRKPFVAPVFSMSLLMWGSLFAPMLLVLLVYLLDSERVDPRIVIRLYFGWSLNGAICFVIKGFVGRLRPNFMVMNSEEIETGREAYKAIIKKKPSYETSSILESRKSFYSAHATAGSYSGTFAVLFLHSLSPKSNLIVSLVKIFVFILGLYPGITQGTAFFHHWTDILAGHLVGIFFAFFAFYFVQ